MTRRRRALTVIWIGAAVVIGLFALGYLGGLRINLTPSYPLGIWRIVPLDREIALGDLVMICPPPTSAFRLARQRDICGRGSVRDG